MTEDEDLIPRGRKVQRQYTVYAIRLRPDVSLRNAFIQRNPNYTVGSTCLYVGSTHLTVEDRLECHRHGRSGSRWVREFVDEGQPISRRHTIKTPFSSRAAAERAEFELAMRLRRRGFGVWTNWPSLPFFYRETCFRTEEPIHRPPQFAVVTAYATTGEVWTPARNQRADRKLQEEIEALRVWRHRIIGYSPTSGHAEPGWATALDFEQACDLGRRFRQDAIYWVDSDRLYLSYCDVRRTPIPLGEFSTRLKPTPCGEPRTGLS